MEAGAWNLLGKDTLKSMKYILTFSPQTSAADTDCHHGIILMSWREVAPSSTYCDLSLTVVNNVTVLPVRKTSVELLVEISHRHEGLTATSKPEPVVPCLPVGDGLPHGDVGELDHVHDGAPPVLTGPAVTACVLKRGSVCVEDIVRELQGRKLAGIPEVRCQCCRSTARESLILYQTSL